MKENVDVLLDSSVSVVTLGQRYGEEEDCRRKRSKVIHVVARGDFC